MGESRGVFLLVAKQDVCFLKGIAVKKVEATLPDKLKNLPIEVIFERTQSELFSQIELSLLTTEPQQVPDKPQEPSQSPLAALFSDPKTYLLALLAERAQDKAAAWWRRRKQKVQPEST